MGLLTFADWYENRPRQSVIYEKACQEENRIPDAQKIIFGVRPSRETIQQTASDGISG